MSRLPRLAACLSLVLMSLAPAQAANTVTLGASPVLGGGEFSSGGGITVAVEPRNSNGRLAICGVWAQSERLIAVLRHSARDVLAKGTIAVNGRAARHDLRFLNRVAPAPSYAGAPATCVLTDRPWQAGARVEVWIPRQLVYLNRSKDGGMEIRFGPSEAANPALKAGSVFPSDWTSTKSKGGTYGMDRPNQ